jgi:hypothetical protein
VISDGPETTPAFLTRGELLEIVEVCDAHYDDAAPAIYRDNPLANMWRRVTKACEESGEIWKAMSRLTGENPRLGACGTQEELLGELADAISAAMCGIQSVTKNTDETWAYVSAAFLKARRRVAEQAAGA